MKHFATGYILQQLMTSGKSLSSTNTDDRVNTKYLQIGFFKTMK